MELTKCELQVMDVLWSAEKPLSRAELLSRSEEKTWKDSSVHILLNSLLRKNAIREVGIVKCSKTFGRTFAPALSREEYYISYAFDHKNAPEALQMVKALAASTGLTADQILSVLTP